VITTIPVSLVRTMICTFVHGSFLDFNDSPRASALGFVLMAAILVMVLVYARLVGSDELTSG